MIGLNAVQGNQPGSLNAPSPGLVSGGNFGALFDEATATASSSGGATTASPSGQRKVSTPYADAVAKLRDALAAFEKEAHKTPAERAHDQILAKHQLSEDGYKALPPDQKKEIDQEIVERTRLLMKTGQTSGDTAAASAGAAAMLS